MYSFRMSFCTVPPRRARGTPFSSATATRNASRIGAVALIVIDTVARSSGIPAKSVRMSPSDATGTPHRPTSPFERAWSES